MNLIALDDVYSFSLIGHRLANHMPLSQVHNIAMILWKLIDIPHLIVLLVV